MSSGILLGAAPFVLLPRRPAFYHRPLTSDPLHPTRLLPPTSYVGPTRLYRRTPYTPRASLTTRLLPRASLTCTGRYITQLKKWENDDPYDGAEIQAAFTGLINAMVDVQLAAGEPVCVCRCTPCRDAPRRAAPRRAVLPRACPFVQMPFNANKALCTVVSLPAALRPMRQD